MYCALCSHWGCLPALEQLITSEASFFSPHIFFSEAANANGSSGNSQEREDHHEYYNEIPGKEPPTGGVLDMRMKVQSDQRVKCPVQCKKQYCSVSTTSAGINICCLLWE